MNITQETIESFIAATKRHDEWFNATAVSLDSHGGLLEFVVLNRDLDQRREDIREFLVKGLKQKREERK